jgi:hypothetical protein
MTVLSREIKRSGSRRIPMIWGTHFEAAMPLKACFATYDPALIASSSLPVDSDSALVQRISDENFNGGYGTRTGLRTFIIGMGGAELNVVAGCTDTIVVQ